MFTAVVATASLNDREVGEYCRRKGIFPEQMARLRERPAARAFRRRPSSSSATLKRQVTWRRFTPCS